MAFAAAAIAPPVPRMLSSGYGASDAGRLCIPSPMRASSSSQISTTTLSSSQLALALSLVPSGRSSPPPWLVASALQEAPAVGGGEAEGSKPSGAEVDGATGANFHERKLYVLNLPWDIPTADVEALFAQCGTVEKVQIMKQNNGKSRGFGFVTMGSNEEAKAAIDKLDSLVLQERIIRVEYAKKKPSEYAKKKPSPSPSPAPAPAPVTSEDAQHVIYVSNLAWKVRSNNLREFFSASFKPVSARVVFDSPAGRTAGYGFVSFATAEEAEAAISELNGKELFGRPLRLKISKKKSDKFSDKEEEAGSTGGLVEV